MKDYKNILGQGIANTLRIATGIVMLSGATTVIAQETDSIPAKARRAAAAAPKYEMKEVSGYVYDAATKTPISRQSGSTRWCIRRRASSAWQRSWARSQPSCRRTCDPKTASEYAYLFEGIKNAAAVTAGISAAESPHRLLRQAQS